MNTYFQELPEDLITEIFEYLQDVDIQKFGYVLKGVVTNDYFKRLFQIKYHHLYSYVQDILDSLNLTGPFCSLESKKDPLQENAWLRIFRYFKTYPFNFELDIVVKRKVYILYRLYFMGNCPNLYNQIVELEKGSKEDPHELKKDPLKFNDLSGSFLIPKGIKKDDLLKESSLWGLLHKFYFYESYVKIHNFILYDNYQVEIYVQELYHGLLQYDNYPQ